MKILRLKNKSGFSTLEIIISLFIFSAVISSVFALIFGNQTSAVNSKIYQDLILSSQLNLEKAKEEAKSSKGDFFYEEEKDGIKNSFNISLLYDYTKEIKSKASLSIVKNKRPVEFNILFSDFEESVGGSTCFRNLPEAESYSRISTLPLNENNKATDIDVVRGKAYITIDSSFAPNFLIVDVSNLDEPVSIGNLTLSRKPKSLHVVGRYAFVVTEVSVTYPQILRVIDVLNPQNPTEEASLTIENSSNGASIFYKDKKIYLGTVKNSEGPEFHTINVSNPLSPSLLGSWGDNVKINDIRIMDNFAFTTATNTVPVRVLDINDYQNIEQIASYETGGNRIHGGQAVSLINNFLVLGRSALNVTDYDELHLFDISEILENGLNFITSEDISNSVRDLIARENMLVLVAGHSIGGNVFQFRSLEEKNSLELIHEISLDQFSKPTALDCEEDVLYVVTENPSNLLIIGKNE